MNFKFYLFFKICNLILAGAEGNMKEAIFQIPRAKWRTYRNKG